MWEGLKDLLTGRRSSSEQAKGRLHLVLAHDRAGLDGGKLHDLRRELAEVISRYVDIDADCVEIDVERVNREDTQLTVSSPLRARRAS
ncbi:MAG: cell division topological specificity factor MinE [Myxococcales bacterium FL481]|nr:MAG: cell division topological specificity factor MinE [Myxococcales bacterium FL481]